MGKADKERDVGTHWDWKLEATVGVGDPVLPSWITGTCCGVQCMGVHPQGAEAGAGWGPIWGHCTVAGQTPFLAVLLPSMLFQKDSANGSVLGFASFGEKA